MKLLNIFFKFAVAYLSLFLIGIVFRTLHWPGGGYLFIFGGLGFPIFLFLSSLFIDFEKVRKIIDYYEKISEDNVFRKLNEE